MPFRACTCKSSAGVKHWPVAWERSDQTLTSPLRRMLGREGKKERAIVQTARGYMSSIPFLSVPFATFTHTFSALLRNGNECLRTGFTRWFQAVRQVFQTNLWPVHVCEGIQTVSFCCHSYQNVTVSIGSWWKSDVGLFLHYYNWNSLSD